MVRTAVRKECISLKTENKVRFLALSAVIAALYAVLTYAAAAVNLAYGPFQFRFSEALTVLPAFTPAAIHALSQSAYFRTSQARSALWTGCSARSRRCSPPAARICCETSNGRRSRSSRPLPPVIFNALIVGFEVSCLSDAGVFGFGNASLAGFAAGAFSVGVGELVVCFALGIPLMVAIRRTKLHELVLC